MIIGSVFGNYRVLSELSTGGMGTVFRAEHLLLRRPAAVKLLRADLTTDAELVQRFINEAKAVTACKHPGIVEVYDFGYTHDGRAFIVMELLEGESLGRRLGRGRLTEPEAAAIAHGVASALKAAHKVGVIHRDLKPDNVFLVPDPDGGPDRTKVLDFGIAKLADGSPTRTHLTEAGVLMGTPRYMAPEQARAARTIDRRADLYSLGCILYHMLVGRPPFVAEAVGEVISLQLFGQVEPPSRLAPITPQMEWLVLRLLEKQPSARFDSAAEVVTALAAFDTMLANRPAWSTTTTGFSEPSRSSGFNDQAPTLPPEQRGLVLDHVARPELAPSGRSAIPIIAGVITGLAIVGVGLAYAMLRGGGDVPMAVDPAVSPASLVAPAPPPPSTTPAATPSAPSAQPGTTAARKPIETKPADHPGRPGRPGRHAAPAGRMTTSPTSPTGTATGPVTRPQAVDSATPDKVIRDIRQVDPPKPGESPANGSAIETGNRPPRPAAPEASKTILPSSDPPKDPTPP